MKSTLKSVAFLAVFSSLPGLAGASGVTWSNFTNWDISNQLVTGHIGSIGVTMQGNGDQAFVNPITQPYSLSSIWTPDSTYSSSFGNGPYYNPGPGNQDIIGLNNAGTETITFSQTVTNPLIALMSWNGSVVSFGNDPIAILNTGGTNCCWGAGSIALNGAGTGFYGASGEANGVIEVLGSYKTITFTDTTPEYWHGYSVGIATPIPAALFFVAPALAGLFGFSRRKAGKCLQA